MTVLDTSAVLDYLLGVGAASEVAELLAREVTAAAPEHLVFEVLAVLRRESARGEFGDGRAASAIDDLGSLALELFPLLPLRQRAFGLRHNLTAGDALFVALAELLGEPLATKDTGLARVASEHSAAEVILLR